MKILKLACIVIGLIVGSNLNAQNPHESIIKTTTTKNYVFKKNGKEIPYQLKIYEKRKYNVTFEKEDKNKLNQDLVDAPDAYVTKLILINTDHNKKYERYIVLRYKKDPSDTFELVPTLKGFAVKVDNKHMEYIMGEGLHFVNNKDKDYFIVDEFDFLD